MTARTTAPFRLTRMKELIFSDSSVRALTTDIMMNIKAYTSRYDEYLLFSFPFIII